jgi:hypothetical protein
MRKFRTRLALRLAPWLKPQPVPVYTTTASTVNPTTFRWTNGPDYGTRVWG